MAKKFLIWGGYGGVNIGDEAILWALSRLLRKLEPSTPQAVLIRGGATPSALAQYAAWNIEVVSGSLATTLRALRTSRLVVGGGQMVDDSSIGWPVGWSSLFLLINKLFSNKSLVVCIGAESLKRPLQRFLVRHIYGLAQACTCRDDESTAILRGVGIPERKAWTTRDVVFSLDRSILPQWQPSSGNKPIRIAVLIAFDPKRIRETTERTSLLIDALLRSGAEIILVAHDLRPDYDVQALLALKQQYASVPAVSASSAQTVDDVLTLYSQCDAVISGRMHPLILAALAGSLPIAFGGKAKVRSLLAVSSIPSLTTDTPETQAAEALRLLDTRPQLLPKIAEVLQGFRSNVESGMARALSL